MFLKFRCRKSPTAVLLGWSAREGDAGSFFQGVFATVLATPCTAPFLGTALGFAFTQSGWMILLMFLAIAAGMSVALFFAFRPARLAPALPKPGAWMERVKQLMGFLLWRRCSFCSGPRRRARRRSNHLGCLFSARAQSRLLDERRFHCPDGIVCARASSRSCSCSRSCLAAASILLAKNLAHARFRCETRVAGDWQPFTPELLAERDRPGPHRLCRFHRGLVSHLQIQRGHCP